MGTGQNLTKANFNKGVSRVVGYPKMTFLNLNASTFVSPYFVTLLNTSNVNIN